TNRFGEAETLMGQVIGNKDFPGRRKVVGDFYMVARKLDEALEQYQQGGKEDQKNALQYDQRILTTYALMGRRDDAIRLAKNLAEKNPKDTSTTQIYASLLLDTGLKTDASKLLA